jgi:hypothetical protein
MEKELLKEAANADKMKEDGRFWAERTRGEAMEEEARQARVGVEDVFDVEDLDGRTGGAPSRGSLREVKGAALGESYSVAKA